MLSLLLTVRLCFLVIPELCVLGRVVQGGGGRTGEVCFYVQEPLSLESLVVLGLLAGWGVEEGQRQGRRAVQMKGISH